MSCPPDHTMICNHRNGQEQDFPLAQMTTVILHIAPGSGLSVGHIGTFAADTKRKAKAHSSGSIIEMQLP